jgi:leader peptidase (prepilin peptidase)/N-methyltransferase
MMCGVVAVWRFGPTWIGLTAFLFLVNLLVIARIDWEHMIIPHTLTVAGMATGLALSPLNGLGIVPSLLGGATGAGLVLFLAHSYKIIRGQIGMGGGDVMLMGMVGTYLGILGVGLVLFGGALLGSCYVFIRYRHGVHGQSKLPFGTFLAGAAALALFAGEIVVSWYLSLLV